MKSKPKKMASSKNSSQEKGQVCLLPLGQRFSPLLAANHSKAGYNESYLRVCALIPHSAPTLPVCPLESAAPMPLPVLAWHLPAVSTPSTGLATPFLGLLV